MWALLGLPVVLLAVPRDATAQATDSTMAASSTVQMQAVGSSGVNGQAWVTGQGNQTKVTVDLTGLQPDSAHAGHVHEGTCSSPGKVVAPLPDISGNANGSGTATATVALAPDSVLDGQHVIAYHRSAGANHGPTITCGAIPGK
jgi:Cu/Zn superoxide dismutase